MAMTPPVAHSAMQLVWSQIVCPERYGLEYDRKKRQERLETATKSLKTAIVKENMREFRAEQEREQQRRRREYGKVGQCRDNNNNAF